MVTREEMDGPDPLDVAMLGEGITPEWWARHMREKAEGAKVTKIASEKGIITDERSYADERVRLDALVQIGRAAGYYAPDRLDLGVKGKGRLTINMNFGEPEKEEDGNG